MLKLEDLWQIMYIMFCWCDMESNIRLASGLFTPNGRTTDFQLKNQQTLLVIRRTIISNELIIFGHSSSKYTRWLELQLIRPFPTTFKTMKHQKIHEHKHISPSIWLPLTNLLTSHRRRRRCSQGPRLPRSRHRTWWGPVGHEGDRRDNVKARLRWQKNTKKMYKSSNFGGAKVSFLSYWRSSIDWRISSYRGSFKFTLQGQWHRATNYQLSMLAIYLNSKSLGRTSNLLESHNLPTIVSHSAYSFQHPSYQALPRPYHSSDSSIHFFTHPTAPCPVWAWA